MKKLIVILGSLMVVALVMVFYAFKIEPTMLAVNKITIENAVDMRVVLFADTHFGTAYNQDNIEKIVEKINEQDPDIVVFAGDFFDHYKEDVDSIDMEYLISWLQKIEGEKFAVRGNHDIGGGIEFLFSNFMYQSGFTLLVNQSTILEEFNIKITGYDDAMLGVTDSELFEQNNDYYNLFLMHEPVDFDKITGNAKGTALAGHTHGGQISLPFITSIITPNGSGDYVKGYYSDDDSDRGLYVTSGIGTTGVNARFATVPEIVVLEFKK